MRTLHASGPVSYAAVSRGRALAVRESRPPAPPKPRLLDRVRQALRARHLSRRTEEAYVAWIRRFIFFHDKRHPAEMGAAEVTKFLTSLAADGQVAASTQNQALSALLFLYTGCSAAHDHGRGLGEYTRRDTPRDVAAYLDPRRSLRADASGWIERPGSQEKGSVPTRYTLQDFAAVAVLRRSAYPVAEL